MLRLPFSLRTPHRKISTKIRLRVESLELRDQPDGLIGDPPTLPSQSPAVTYAPSLTNNPPTIKIESAKEIGNGLFVISGRVSDEHPGGLTVTLGGGTSASGQTCVTKSDGTFMMTVQLQVDGSDSGVITATTKDALGLVSNEDFAYVTPTAP